MFSMIEKKEKNGEQKRLGYLRNLSIDVFIVIAFITVTTIMLAGFGIVDYKLEKERQWKNLNKELSLTAEQLKSSLIIPVWNLDNIQIEKIIESSMSNQNIYGVNVSVDNNHYIRSRGTGWEIITPTKDISSDGFLSEKRDIVYSGEKLGVVEIYGSTHLLERNLRTIFISIMSFITVFVFMVIIGLFLVLHIIILKPVRNIERYTLAVSSGDGKGLKIPGYYFQGELNTLRSSIEKMVNAHEDRFMELQNEVKLRTESEERFRTIFDSSSDALLICDENTGDILHVNEKMCEMFGYTYDEATQNNIGIINADELRYNPKKAFEKAKNSPTQSYSRELKTRKKNDNTFWAEISIKDIIIDNQHRALVEIRDITMRKNAEEEKEKLETQLRQSQKMEAVGTLAGGIAHDFNNILSVILGFGSMLQMQLEKGNPMHRYVDQIVLASEKATNLVRSLLSFSRKQAVLLQPVKLNEIIKGVEKLLRTSLTEDISLHINLAEHDLVIMGDATQIEQILFNLASNARDAMPGGGRLIIETKLMEFKDDFTDILGYGEPGTYALLSVSDTGKGIDKETREHIFDPFYTTKDVGKGTGLGLSTVYGVVKQHNGYVTVYSEPDMGAVFHIYFPIVSVNVEDRKHEPALITGGKETILIAEDNENVRFFLKTVLTKYGYKVIEAEDGEDAVQKIKAHDGIDLMILDSVMPKKNGREVYDEVRTDRPDIKVLFTSGYTRDIVLDKGIEEKEVEFISKPLTQKTLLGKVREVLDSR